MNSKTDEYNRVMIRHNQVVETTKTLVSQVEDARLRALLTKAMRVLRSDMELVTNMAARDTEFARFAADDMRFGPYVPVGQKFH